MDTFYETILLNWIVKIRLPQMQPSKRKAIPQRGQQCPSDPNKVTKDQETERIRPLGRARDTLFLPEHDPSPSLGHLFSIAGTQ